MNNTQPRVSVDQVHAAVSARNMDLAIRLAEQAYAQGLEHPSVLNLVAYKLELEDKPEEALQVLERARRLSPDDQFVLNSIGVCLSKTNRPAEALQAFEQALFIDPNFAQAHNGRGLALAGLGDKSAAKLAQQRAAELDPGFPEPVGALAALAAEEKDWESARKLAERALALEPGQPAASLALAAAELAEGDAAAAEARVSRLISGGRLTRLHLSGALNIKADALEALGRPREAMAAYIEANRGLHEVQVKALNAPELGLDLCRRFIRYFEAAPAEAWRPAPETSRFGGEEGHVFLVGFARSGTTLLEQILASHPQMVALEEKPTLDDFIMEFIGHDAALDRLAAIDEAEADRWRELYWKRVREFDVEPRGKVFVDKLPLHTIYLPFIAKLFPRAKILFARRDPRDVVVSCFRHRFRPNPITVELTDLKRAAEVYSAVMRLAEIYSEKLTLPVHIHRHEDLVENLDAETQAICAFVGLPWDANMRNFVETANRRDIRTPSADQVRRGLYKESLARWRGYGDTIDVIKPILEPWVKAFGYPAE
ncbi:sulfotransferase [Phenylobacterium sp.]|uniref:tetratricopeptide repeat-containing sulfotransferase family protein n=1 Tax=Phenylobacterium sp. TaxID=1871053 RepID=UPI0035AE2CBB